MLAKNAVNANTAEAGAGDGAAAPKAAAPLVALLGITVVSMSLLTFQICLTRLLSVLLSYHSVYGVTSLAMLGSGLGGFAVRYLGKGVGTPEAGRLWSGTPEAEGLWRKLILLPALIALCMTVSVLSVIGISRVTTGGILSFGLLLCAPFFFGGMFLAGLFQAFPPAGGKLYFADMSGAALGCALAVFSLDLLGDAGSVILFSFFLSALSLFMVVLRRSGRTGLRLPRADAPRARGAGFRPGPQTVSVAVFLALILLLPAGGGALFQIPIGVNPEKEIHDSLRLFDGAIVETRHSAFGRTDLIQYGAIDAHMDIYLDGTAGTPMYAFNGDMRNPDAGVAELKNFPGFFPLSRLSPEARENALIIGPGGGRDVLLALLAGVGEVTAVEVNPDLVDLVRDYASYNGGIYTDLENVELILDEGRSFLRSAGADAYDLVLMSLPRTNSSRSVEGYALTENYLFTTDSIGEYLERLSEGGQLTVVANDDAEILRLLSLTLRVFEERGVSVAEAMRSLYIFGADPNPVFVLRKGAFAEADIGEIRRAAADAPGYNPAVSFFPDSGGEGGLHPLFLSLEAGRLGLSELVSMVEGLGYDVSPVSDDDPFFYKLTVGLPDSVTRVLLPALFLLVLLIAALFVFEKGGASSGGRGRKTGKALAGRGKLRLSAVFCLLGAGYMIVEISMIQKFVFFLGKPVLSMSVILFSVLLGSGAGGFLSGGVGIGNARRVMSGAALAVALLLLLYDQMLLPAVFRGFLGLSFMGRAALSVGLVLPLSLLLGIVFPLMLRGLSAPNDRSLIPWMWGINAVSSVVGSAFAVVLAIGFGYHEAVGVAALCYLGVCALLWPGGGGRGFNGAGLLPAEFNR